MATQQLPEPIGRPSMRNPLWGPTFSHQDCMGLFISFEKCYVQADIPERECAGWKEDYIECKMRTKEASLPL